jgi:hypothetical protein
MYIEDRYIYDVCYDIMYDIGKIGNKERKKIFVMMDRLLH